MIQLNVMKNHGDIVSVIPKGNMLLECCEHTGIHAAGIYFRLYNPEDHSVSQIGTGLQFCPFSELQNAIWNSSDCYLPAYTVLNPGRFRMDIHKINTKSGKGSVIYSFEEDGLLTKKEKRLKIFVLSESILMIQHELLDPTDKEKRMGHIRFTQTLVNLETKEEIEVKDENLNNNGLNLIIPISSSQYMTKTGYSCLEDDRFRYQSEEDALIESVSVHTTSRYLADLQIGGTAAIDATLITSAYFKDYILKPHYKDGYVFFTTVNPEENSSVSVFYNCATLEQLTCRNDSLDRKDPDTGFVIAGQPYVKNTAMKETRFLNLKTMEFDLSAMDGEFVDICGDLFILKNHKKHKENVLEFYRYPEMKLVLKEEGDSVTCCNYENEYYFYIYKNKGSDLKPGSER